MSLDREGNVNDAGQLNEKALDAACVSSERRGYRRWERPARWILIGAMIATGIWWILHAPYDPDAVWRAIPVDAVFFSRHDQAADRLPELSRNPLIMTLLLSTGIAPSALHSLNDDPDTERWVRELFGRDVVLAYVPNLGGSNEPAWVFASWIGNRVQHLRWTLSIRGIPGIRAVDLPGRETFWLLDDDPVESGKHLSLALADGYLLGCISDFSMGVKIPMATWNRERGYASLRESAWREDAETLAGSGMPDWGAYRLRHRERPGERQGAMVVALQQLESSYAKGRVTGSFAAPVAPGTDLLSASALEGLQDILGDAPVLSTFVSPTLFTFLTEQSYTLHWAAVLAEALGTVADGVVTNATAPGREPGKSEYPFFVSVLDQRYAGSISSGRERGWAGMAGVRVPAIVAGMHVGHAERADTLLMDILDRLNREYRLGLIPRRAPLETVTVIEDSRSGNSLYQRLRLQERVGVVYQSGWLLVAGQSAVLERLLESANRHNEPPAEYRWIPPSEADTAPVYLWTDLTAFAPLVNDALAALSLMLWVQDPHHSHAIRQTLANTRAWIESVRVMEQGRIWLDGVDPNFNLRFELGIPAADTRGL